jgi:hypothetical protein
MKSFVPDGDGQVRLSDVDEVSPAAGEAVIEVEAFSVNRGSGRDGTGTPPLPGRQADQARQGWWIVRSTPVLLTIHHQARTATLGVRR